MRLFSLHLQWKTLFACLFQCSPTCLFLLRSPPSTDGRLITFINFLSLHHKHFFSPLYFLSFLLVRYFALRNLINKIDFSCSFVLPFSLFISFWLCLSCTQNLQRKFFTATSELSIIRKIPLNIFFILFFFSFLFAFSPFVVERKIDENHWNDFSRLAEIWRALWRRTTKGRIERFLINLYLSLLVLWLLPFGTRQSLGFRDHSKWKLLVKILSLSSDHQKIFSRNA